ncbi:MAG: gliding motility-associated C-terminal domain-containing protein [Bacteroidota bacterium]
MNQQFILSACLTFFFSLSLQAQFPASPIINGELGKASTILGKSEPCPGQDAGTIESLNPIDVFQSNDIELDTVYFCFGDRMLINHAEDFTLDGDPDPSTMGGVAYAFYFDRPTVDGSTLADIQSDPFVVPNPLDPVSRIAITANISTDADILFVNDGSIQNTFNAGEPFLLWFAPITVDSFAARELGGVERFFPVYEGTPAGSCVSVSIDEAFAVAYLNPIQANGTTIDTDNLTGTFEIGGGLPQLDPNANFTISIVNADDPNILGTVTTGAVGHAEDVGFTVPELGNYIVTVEDGKSCTLSFELAFVEGVAINIGSTNIPMDGSGCIDVTVENFTDVSSFQFEMMWNNNVLRFDSVTNLNPNLSGYSISNSFGTDDALTLGTLRTIWADVNTFAPVTFSDGEVLFSICFSARGDEGECGDVDIDFNSGLSVEVTDPDGMPYNLQVLGGQVCISNSAFLVDFDKTDIGCTPGELGSITFIPENGVAPYRYELLLPDGTIVASGDNIAEGETVMIENLAADVYDLVVFDQTSNPGVIEPVTIEGIIIEEVDNFGVDIETDFVPISCNGLSDGAIRVLIFEEGVVVPNPENNYSFLWNTGDTTSVIRDVGFGDYSVTVTGTSCTKIASSSVSQPAPILLQQDLTRSQNSTCPGINDGLIVVEVDGGFTDVSNEYSFKWNLTAINDVEVGNPIQLGGLTGGTYSLTVTDDNQCEQTAEYAVGFDKTLSISENITDVTCFGGNDGIISITGSTVGGNEAIPYSFTWEGLDGSIPADTENTSTVSTLTEGTYVVTMEDNTILNNPLLSDFRCMIRDTFQLTQPEQIQLNFTQEDATCTGGLDNGRIELDEPIGGTAPYTYEWDSLPNVTGRIADSLTIGAYKVILTDANGCMDSLDFQISAPDLPRITNVSSDTLNCSSDTNGQLTVDFENGASGAVVTSFEWTSGDNTQTTSPNLGPGVYAIRITDTNGCFAIDTGVVIAPDPLVLDSIAAISPDCPGFNNGQLTVFVSGGTAPLTYTNTTTNISLNAPVFSTLTSGTYNILVEDANGCPGLETDVVIAEPPSIVVTFTQVEDTECADGQGPFGCTGSAVASAILSDGTERTFDFQWQDSNEQTVNAISSTATQLCEGINTLFVQDDIDENGCSVTVEVEIGSPPRIEPFVEDISFVSCNGENDGTITIGVLGGTPDFEFDWSNGETSMTISDLAPDDYQVTITDANGCEEISSTIAMQEPDPIRLSVSDASQTVTCAGDEDGFIQLRVDGGNGLGGAPFDWAGGVAGARDSLAVDLSPGTYFVTVVDARGCTDSTSYTIGEPSLIMATIPVPPEPACFGFQTNIIVTDASGGAGGPYSFAVNNLSKTTLAGSIPVFGGQEHMISVFDVRGCSFDTTIFINQPPPVEVVLPEEIEVQLGDSLRLRPDVFSVAPIDTSTILWTPSEFLSTTSELNPIIRPVNSGEYFLTLMDLNGCMGEASVFIDVDKKRNVYIPNVFSPNSIRNSQFEVGFGAGVRKMNFMRVYDRWGELVYELGESGPSIGGIGDWDGTFNNQPLPSGVYVYLIEVEFEDNITLLYRGDVTILY